MIERLSRLLLSPANWTGLVLATVTLVLANLGYIGAWGAWLVGLGYVAGFAIGGLWLGFPRWSEPPWEAALEFKDEGDARASMMRALEGVRALVSRNPGKRLPAPIAERVLGLCDSLENLLNQWEGSRGSLSLEESFHARHIAISYLPDALNSYLSIPPAFAATKVLADGKTAQQTFRETLNELDGKVKELADDLAGQDAQAFLSHSRFLRDKFATGEALRLPSALTSPEKPDVRR